MRAPSTLRRRKWPPRYTDVFLWRQQQLLAMRARPELIRGAKKYYSTRPAEFINHWVDTFDPRKAGTGLSKMPLVMFTRQHDLVDFLQAMVEGDQDGLIEKCRDMGATWVCCAFSVWMWLFLDGATIGWGSRKQDLVDRIGVMDSIFEKMRFIIKRLPPEFLPEGFHSVDHMPFMRILNPQTGAAITGEAGDNIGRGGRNRVYFKDESAHYERPEMIEAALGDNTRVQIDISSVNGVGNVFHRKREAGIEWEDGPALRGATNVFVMEWKDHPDKDEEWYKARKQKAEDGGLQHVFAQEIDRRYDASVEGVMIRLEWVQAAIDSHLKLGIKPFGKPVYALDVADGGLDLNALVGRSGVILTHAESWGERDTGVTARRAVTSVPPNSQVEYDCIGVGAGVKAEVNRLEEEGLMPKGTTFVAWMASARPLDAEEHLIPDDEESPLNEDFFMNIKAQGWWQLARRFEKTYKAVVQGIPYPHDELISISSALPARVLRQIEKELTQVTSKQSTGSLKLMVNKAPDGTRSPNIGDAIMMAYWPVPHNYYTLEIA